MLARFAGWIAPIYWPSSQANSTAALVQSSVRMKLKNKFFSSRLAGPVGGVLVFAIGFFLVAFDSHLSRTLTRASYDWSFGLSRFARTDLSGSDVVIIYIDEDSLKE